MKIESLGSNLIITLQQEAVIQRKKINEDWKEWNIDNWVEPIVGVPFIYNLKKFSDYDIPDGLYLYRVSYDNRNSWITSLLQKIGNEKVGFTFGNYKIDGESWGEVLTPDDLRFTYLWGVDFQASNGEIFTDEQIKWTINSALREVERRLNYNFTKKIIKCGDSEDLKENNDYIEESAYTMKRNNQIVLREIPVVSVDRFEMYSYIDSKILDLKEWMFLDKNKGILEYRPRNNFAHYHSGIINYSVMGMRNYRHAYRVDYVVGLKNCFMVPEDVRDIVGKISAMKLLNTIGDGLIAGFSSSSLSMDGLSESFSSTQSATSAYFGARIKVYQDDVENWFINNMRKFKRLVLGSI